VGDQAGQGAALDALGDVVDGGADDVVAATDGEGLGVLVRLERASYYSGEQ